MNEYLEPEFDFSMLDEYDLIDITTDDIVQVYRSGNVHIEDLTGFPLHYFRYLVVGFTMKMKPLSMIVDHQTENVRIQMVRCADELDIKAFWCKK